MVETFFSEDSQIINIILIAIALLLLMAVAMVFFFYFSRRRIIKSELEKAIMEIEHQKEVIQSSIITQEEERKRIAQDLHDAISSMLNIVSLNANFLTEPSISSEETHKIGSNILKVTTTILESSRQIAHDLLPPTLDKFGLEAALEELCEEVNEGNTFNLEYNFQYPENLLNKSEELHLFRIAQELFNNTIKHSGATHIKLTLDFKEDIVHLQYTDNGKGFNIQETRHRKGLGMSGIENRVIILNGNMEIISSEGKGIQVLIKIKT